jgi:hypothetical protein
VSDQLEPSTEVGVGGEALSMEVGQGWAEVGGQEEGKARRVG